MGYFRLKSEKLPIGSGVVESAVRRVVNQRFKSASQFWLTDHLGPLLELRALWKSGRWDTFFRARLRGRFWIPDAKLLEANLPTPAMEAA